MVTRAPYDQIADWYEHEFLVRQRSGGTGESFADSLGIDQALVDLLGAGHGTCLEVGCGTGIYAERMRTLGWKPVGIDLSAGMLRHARDRLPSVQGDACHLPFATDSLPAAAAVMIHTDLPDYSPVLSEAYRVLAPGGRLVHIGVHPCFCGGFADRTDPRAVVIKPGYLDGNWTTDSWTDQGLRDKVGAAHAPLASLLNMVSDIGFVIERFAEGATPTPVVLSFRATKPSANERT